MARRKYAKQTTQDDCTPGKHNTVDMMAWTVDRYYSAANGRSALTMTCPFCRQMNIAYVWSLRGSGKRCENRQCGALFGSGGKAYRLRAEAV